MHTTCESLLALLCGQKGLSQVLMGLFDLASAVRFLSQPTLSGFVTGGAVLIIISQLKSFFGYTALPPSGGGPFSKVSACVQQLGEANWINVALCSLLMLVLIVCKRLKAMARRRKTVTWKLLGQVAQVKEILVVLIGISFVRLTSHDEPLVPVVGHIPQGLPAFQPPWRLEATQKLLQGPTDVLRNFLISGVIVAFSCFLTPLGITFSPVFGLFQVLIASHGSFLGPIAASRSRRLPATTT